MGMERVACSRQQSHDEVRSNYLINWLLVMITICGTYLLSKLLKLKCNNS